MQDRIADELDRSDLTTQIQRSIKSAVEFYEKQRFFFNEQRTLSFATVDGQELYSSADDSDIPNLLFIDTMRIAITATDKYSLERVLYEDLVEISDSSTADEGQPTSYAYYAKQIRLYPIPDASYSILVSGVWKLGDLSLTTDTNAWMTDGEGLIRSRAKWALYTHVIKDLESGRLMKQAELDELQALVEASASRNGLSRIDPTIF